MMTTMMTRMTTSEDSAGDACDLKADDPVLI
jgi:hypothetical protein